MLAVNPINHNNPPKPVRRSETAADPGSDKKQKHLPQGQRRRDYANEETGGVQPNKPLKI